MTDWYERASNALQLAGYAKKSQQVYLRSIRMLVEHTGKTPDLVTEEELQEYFLPPQKRQPLGFGDHAHLLQQPALLLHAAPAA